MSWLSSFMATKLTSPAGFVEARYEARAARLERRLARAWREYLATTRNLRDDLYDQTERQAWRRLLGIRADIKRDKRAYQQDRDAAIADLKDSQ